MSSQLAPAATGRPGLTTTDLKNHQLWRWPSPTATSHPRWERNLGTGDDPATSARMLPSHRAIDLSVSRVVLPVAHPAGA